MTKSFQTIANLPERPPRGEPHPTSLGSPFMASWRLAAYVVLVLVCAPLQALALALGLRLARTFPFWFHRQCLKIFGIKVVRRGRQSRARPTLYVCNHVSYWDISILGALIRGSFVAKAEVADWPVFGLMAKLQRSVFVDRRPSRTAVQRDEMTKRLEEGDDLILFPEGTSGDGNRVLPFKSALFSVAERRPHGAPLRVQPVSLAYTALDGVPMGRYLRPSFAWYGDMDLAPHMWESAGLGKLTVVVEFHPVVTFEDFDSRKAMAGYCHKEVSQGVSAALSGRSRRQIQARQEPELPPPPGQAKPQPLVEPSGDSVATT